MKNRKTVIVAFLLVAAMLLGVGYAALTDTLTINGTLAANAEDFKDEFEEDIYFSAVDNITYSNSATSGVTATVDADAKPDDVSFELAAGTLKNKDEYITLTYTIKSESDLPATITLDPITNSDHFTVTTDWNGAKTLAAGGTITVTVTVTLTKTPSENVTGETVKLTFNATT